MRLRQVLMSFVSLALLAYAVMPGSTASAASPACVTRQQFVLDVDQAAGITPIYPGTPTFTDVAASSAYYGYIEAAVKDGIIDGTSSTTFSPLGCLTRAQIAKIEVLGLGYASQASALSFQPTSFADDSAIPSWARGYVAEAVAIGLVHGYLDNTYRPDRSMTATDEGFFIAQYRTTLANRNFVISAASTDVGEGQPMALSSSGTTQPVTYSVVSPNALISGSTFVAKAPGTYVVTGTTSGGTRATLTVSVYGAPVALRMNVPPAIVVNAPTAQTVTVDIVDAAGNTVADAGDAITISGYGQALTAPTSAAVSAVDGVATFSFKAGATAGKADTLTASDITDPGIPTVTATTPTSAVGIVVTTNDDVVNGDVSSVAALEADPGPDGISLREALTATNNSPGNYAITFAPSLQGTTIDVGAGGWGILPPLTGGGVTIDGDIGGSGSPGITLVNQTGSGTSYGLDIVSSGNHLYSLALQGFSEGVVFTAVPEGSGDPLPVGVGLTFSGNVVEGVVITGASSAGIRIFPDEVSWPLSIPQCIPTACQTNSIWTDTTFADNTIEVDGRPSEGIDVELANTAGATVDGLTIQKNVIEVAPDGVGVSFTAGGGAHADGNRIEGVLVADNTIDVQARGSGINAWSGYQGGSANLVSNVQFVGNTIRFEGVPAAGNVNTAITLALSDGCGPPGECGQAGAASPKDNLGSNIKIASNLIEGETDGIVMTGPCCGGATGSTLSGLEITGNTIRASIPPQDPSPWGIEISTGGGVNVSNVMVAHNSVTQQTPGNLSGYAAYLAGGGIAVIGGLGTTNALIQNVTISNNLVASPLIGIVVIGSGPNYDFPLESSGNDRVEGVSLLDNTITGAPVLATRWNAQLLGISVIGGLGGPKPSGGDWQSIGSAVACVTLKGNLVAGRHDAVSVFANLGAGASGNQAQLGGC